MKEDNATRNKVSARLTRGKEVVFPLLAAFSITAQQKGNIQLCTCTYLCIMLAVTEHTAIRWEWDVIFEGVEDSLCSSQLKMHEV